MKLLTHRITAAVVFFISLIVYGKTVADTVSFWDCGEFIAASFTMGVPHPPGTPLYMMFGRLFSMIPFSDDIAFRVNWFSVLVSALTVWLLYLSIVRMARIWRGPEVTISDKITVYGGSAIGALAFAFSTSFWFNAVEAEVYSSSMFFTALVFYIALWWLDHTDDPLSNRLLLLVFYIIGLSTGVHLLNVLTIPAITYLVAFKKVNLTVRSFIITGIVGCIALLLIYPGIIQGVPIFIRDYGITVFIILILAVFFGALYCNKRDWRTASFSLFAFLLVVIGYSTFLTIKIRSGLNPFLDENNPETWASLVAYINREQYGSESMFMTIFDRKAPFWEYQIKHMYFRYLDWQFLNFPKFWGIPFLLGLIGVVHQFYKDARGGFTVLSLFILTGLAIVLYVNQEDPQPRDRDYSYVGSFYAYAIWIGLGVIAIIEMLQDKLRKIDPKFIGWAVVVLMLLLAPFNMLVKNYHEQDRTGNYVAWDYSYNLLMTCEQDGILYTNGDNDTFPLWYLQMVEGVREDVRVANLSLLNTGWFISQIRDKEPKVPMTARISDYYIENVIDSRDMTGLMDRRWEQSRRVTVPGLPVPNAQPLTWDVPGTLSYPIGPGGKNEHFLRVQDVMILNTLVANKWEKPMYFAVTVSDQNLLGLRNQQNQSLNFLSMEGLAFKITPSSTPVIDPAKMAHNLLRVYKYRNLDNPDVYYDESVIRLMGNYRQAFLQLAFHYLQLGEGSEVDPKYKSMSLEQRVNQFEELPNSTKALTMLEFMDQTIPEDVVPIGYEVVSLQIGRLFAQLGKPEELSKRLDRILKESPVNAQMAYEYGSYFLYDGASYERGKELFEHSLRLDPSIDNLYRIAYTWTQLTNDEEYAEQLYIRHLNKANTREAQMGVLNQARAMGLDKVVLEVYNRIRLVDPNDKMAVYGLIDHYTRTIEYEKALQLANEYLSVYPNDPEILSQKDTLTALIGK